MGYFENTASLLEGRLLGKGLRAVCGSQRGSLTSSDTKDLSQPMDSAASHPSSISRARHSSPSGQRFHRRENDHSCERSVLASIHFSQALLIDLPITLLL